MGENTPVKRIFSELSPATPQHEEKRLNLEEEENFPEDTPEWAKHLHRTLIRSINQSINFATCTAEEAKKVATANSNDITQLKDDNENLKTRLEKLEKRVIGLEAYGRRENLLLHGVTENKGENCAETVTEILISAGIPIKENSYPIFSRIHRLSVDQQQPNVPRPIIMRFHHSQDRQTVWYNRSKFGDNIYVTEDYPREIKDNRRILSPYLALARRLPTIKKASLREDRLIIDGKIYTASDLHKLPADFSKESLSTQTQDEVTAFFSKDSKLSNFYPCCFTVDNIKYMSVEQFYTAKKALFAHQEEQLQNIMADPTPEAAHRTSKSISSTFHQAQKKKWQKKAPGILKEGMLAKFNQVTELKQYLLNTDNNCLVEASLDRFWGCGRPLQDNRVFNKEKWRGQNKTGQLLMEVREAMRAADK